MRTPIIIFLFAIVFSSCNNSPDIFKTKEGKEIRNKVDRALNLLDKSISDYELITRIDHSRLAENEGVYTPPAIVSIFSNPAVNSEIIKENQFAAIDLPFKVLVYSEPDLKDVSIAYTSTEFIIKRHVLNKNVLKAYDNEITKIINTFPKSSIASLDINKFDENYGLIVIKSDFDFNTTINNLLEGVNSQGDTEVFGQIDFAKEAAELNIELNPTTLILFGAPAPGGKAMNNYPRLGLDAFCQKLLIIENDEGVFVAYNDIIEFSELYYNDWNIPQRVINYRLSSVFENAAIK